MNIAKFVLMCSTGESFYKVNFKFIVMALVGTSTRDLKLTDIFTALVTLLAFSGPHSHHLVLPLGFDRRKKSRVVLYRKKIRTCIETISRNKNNVKFFGTWGVNFNLFSLLSTL